MAECEKVCRYIDLPLQHASADVLKRMRRPGQPARPTTGCSRGSATAFPASHCGRRSSSGFPGETDADFAELDGFVADTGFDHVGVFTYSHEEGTRAFALADDVPAAVKRRRRNALMARQKRIVRGALRRRGSGREVRGAGRRPVARARAGAAGPARRPGARHRPGRLPDRLRPGGLSRRASSSRRESSARRGYDLVAAPIA